MIGEQPVGREGEEAVQVVGGVVGYHAYYGDQDKKEVGSGDKR